MVTNFRCWGITLLLSLLFLVTGGISAWGKEVRVGAGAAPTENVFNKVKEPMEKAIGLKLTLIDNGPYEALVELDQGKVDAAAGGLTFADWMSMMEKKGYQVPDRNAYKYRVIGKDLIKVIAHPGIPVKKLSKEQLKGMFAGKIGNWKEVGGPDLAVVVVWGSKIPGTQSVFRKIIMDGEEYAKNVKEATNAPDVKSKVIATPGGVGLAPLSLTDATVIVPEIPEVGRPITLITKGEPSPLVVEMLDFIRGDGQKYLTK